MKRPYIRLCEHTFLNNGILRLRLRSAQNDKAERSHYGSHPELVEPVGRRQAGSQHVERCVSTNLSLPPGGRWHRKVSEGACGTKIIRSLIVTHSPSVFALRQIQLPPRGSLTFVQT